MQRRTLYIAILTTLCCLSCTHEKVNHRARTPIAEYEGRYLYVESLNHSLSYNVSSEDSARIIKSAVMEWVSDLQIEDLASRNIDVTGDIEQKVADYRRQLILYEYEKQIIHKNFENEITPAEIELFYEKNRDLYIASRHLLRGFVIKVPSSASAPVKIRNWVKSADSDAMENIEKFCVNNAISYNYFRDKWMPLEEVFDKYKELSNETINSFANRNVFECRDSASFTFIRIDSFCMINKPMPIDYVTPQIAELIKKRKEIDFMEQVRRDLLNKSIKNNKIHFQKGFEAFELDKPFHTNNKLTTDE